METNMISAIVFLYLCNLIFPTSAQEPYTHTVCEYTSPTRYYYCPLLEECCYLNGKWKCIDTVFSAVHGDYGKQPSCEKKPTQSKDPSTINTYPTDNSDETTSSGTIV